MFQILHGTNSTLDIHVLKNNSLCIGNSNLTVHSVCLFANLGNPIKTRKFNSMCHNNKDISKYIILYNKSPKITIHPLNNDTVYHPMSLVCLFS